MAGYNGGWAPYVSVGQRHAKAARAMAKLRKQGYPVSPVTVEGLKIGKSFWGKAWCDNLESYHDYENRLPRGRTYVRNGSVVDLQVAPLSVTAIVSGSELYNIKIQIKPVPKPQWKTICQDCVGGIDSLVELLQGKFSKGVMERLCRQNEGLFPKPSQIEFSCDCPDYATMCKHVAAALYGIGARLDQSPELLFRLRDVDEKDLLANLDSTVPLSKAALSADKILESDDMSALFGLEMADSEGPVTETAPPPEKPARKAKPKPKPKPKPKTAKAVKPVAKPKYELTADGSVKWWKE
ncbi:MAG: hypothetical protein RL367_1547 [Pseudomonadota bacterium]